LVSGRERGVKASGGGRAGVVHLVVPPESSGTRLDRFAAAALGVSRTEMQRWIEHACVTVEGVHRPGSAAIRTGERVEVWPEPAALTDAAADPSVRFDVLHTDDDLVVIDKPAGLVVHPGKGHASGTLVNGLLALGLFAAELQQAGDEEGHQRPGIVHRLDKGTTGVMVVARTATAREALKAQFQAHTIERAYLAIVVGDAEDRTFSTLHGRDPRDRQRFTSRVRDGKRAVTRVRVVERLQGATLVECTLETGRTHQIRMHLSESGTPVLGDPLYGRPPRSIAMRALGEALGHQALHAMVLGFDHPRTGERVRFTSGPPAAFLATAQELRAVRRAGA
jgi:23S rRNA pseudouridine1911/1915/1917 synthase